jgi:hypothetical protein
MKKTLCVFAIILILSLCVSCSQKSALPYDAVWHKGLIKRSEEIEKSSMNALDFKGMSDWRKIRPEIPLENSDTNNLQFIMLESYQIDSASWANFTPTTRLKSILTVDKEEASYFILKDDVFIFSGLYNLKKSRWKQTTLIQKSASDSISERCLRKKLPFVFVYIKTGYEFGDVHCCVYVENGIFKRMGLTGRSEPFIDYLVDLKKQI